jgi:FdhD protein
MIPTDHPIQLYQFNSSNGWGVLPSRIIGESSVSLTVNGEVWLSFMCTPADLDAMAVGFLFNEGIIQGYGDVSAVSTCANGSNVDVWLNRSVQKPTQWRRTSGCTGGVTAALSHRTQRIATQNDHLAPEMVLNAMDGLLKAQDLYREARGVHCSAVSDGLQIQYHAEDIGRHNTLDKLAGQMLIYPKPLARRIILTTGRISSEMLQKSDRLGASVVVSRTSPTSLSVEMAEDAGITLIGYARRNQFLVYTHPERLSLEKFIQKAVPVVLHV